MCLRSTSTTSSKIHPNIKAAISKSEIDSVTFGFFCVTSDYFISGINSCLHTIGSRSSVTPIHAPPQLYPDGSMNAMYAGSPDMSYAHLVGYAATSCGSFHIKSTNFITAVDFARFTHNGSHPSTAFTSTNIPFTNGMPIV